MANAPKSTVFDYERYGVFLRSARQRAGYNRAETFCEIVTDWTGVQVNKEALYRIERGVQPPTVEQLIAFGLVLFHGKGINNVLNKTELHHCVTAYAEYFAGRDAALGCIMAYDGLFYDFASDGTHYPTSLVTPDDVSASYLDEHYFEKLFERSE